MKKTQILKASLMALWLLTGCATTRTSMTGDTEKKGWSEFIGQEVTEIKTVHPDGDAPRSLIYTEDGKKKIY